MGSPWVGYPLDAHGGGPPYGRTSCFAARCSPLNQCPRGSSRHSRVSSPVPRVRAHSGASLRVGGQDAGAHPRPS
jgi:hypothetical protein